MIQIASFTLVLALLCSLYGMFAAVMGLRTRQTRWLASMTHAFHALAGLLTLALLLLWYFLLGRDFRMAYVAKFTDLSLAPLYVLSAVWAGQEGSLLLWSWMIAACSAIYVSSAFRNTRFAGAHLPLIVPQHRTAARELGFAALMLAFVQGCFLLLLVSASNPFALSPVVPYDGQGMNPLLQNPYMVTHPPLLFFGYAGFAVPAALAVAALCNGTTSAAWLNALRRWALASWYFLGMGIILGAHWAYLELGWGGYWAWDPVENASFIPWISSTALLHTAILQHRTGGLRRWNIFLSIATFQLCVFGTFLTRSGVLASVHAYAESPVAIHFLTLLLVNACIMGGLLVWRWNKLRSPKLSVPLLSKEQSFYLANQVLMGIGFAVLYGTVYPLLSDMLFGKQVVIGPSFFNKVNVPLALALLVMLAICQALPWNAISVKDIAAAFRFPAACATLAVIALTAFAVTNGLALLTCGVSVWIVTGMVSDRKRLWRPYALFHLGIVAMCVGIAISSTYKIQQNVTLRPGESVSLGHFRVQYLRWASREEDDRSIVETPCDVFRGERWLATISPAKHFYGDPDAGGQVTTEAGLYTSFGNDVYVILDGWDADKRAHFIVTLHPMILWIWIGGVAVMSVAMIAWTGTAFFRDKNRRHSDTT